MGEKRAVVLGAGGHAKVTIELLRASGFEVVGVVCPEGTGDVLGAPVLGADDRLPALRADGVEFAAVGVGAVGPGTDRGELHARAVRLGFVTPTLIHPAAYVAPSAELAAGVAVCAGAVVQSAARLEANVLVNTRAVVEHDCQIGPHAHLASGSVLAGGVQVGARALIGAGASVRQGLSIGDDAVVGLGAAVISDVPPGAVAFGVPARLRERPQ